MWKQRIYAFLLRRILGPYLTPASKAKLVHESIDIAITEGKFQFKDIELDVDVINSLLPLPSSDETSPSDHPSQNGNKSRGRIQFQQICIHKLSIDLQLVDKDTCRESGDANSATTDISENKIHAAMHSHTQSVHRGPNEQQEHRQEPMDEEATLCTFGKTIGTATNVLRKIYKLGSTSTTEETQNMSGRKNAGLGVSLLAHLDLEGIDIEVVSVTIPSTMNTDCGTKKPSYHHMGTSTATQSGSCKDHGDENMITGAVGTASTTTTDVITTSSSSNMSGSMASRLISSYVDAAMKSLQLRLDLSSIQIRFSTRTHQHAKQSNYVSLSIDSASYHDIPSSKSSSIHANLFPSSNSEPTVLLQKEIRFAGVKVDVGTNASDRSTSNGNEYFSSENATWIRWNGEGTLRMLLAIHPKQHLLQRMCDISLEKQLSCCFDKDILNVLLSFLQDSTCCSPPLNLTNETVTMRSSDQNTLDQRRGCSQEQVTQCTDEDENDAGILASILKQHEEALQRAATKELRGGVLVPSVIADLEGKLHVSYDTFFDANDHSFSQYQTLMGTTDMRNVTNDVMSVKTKVFFHLAGLAIEFKTRPDHSGSIDETKSSKGSLCLSFQGIAAEISQSGDAVVYAITVKQLCGQDINDVWTKNFFCSQEHLVGPVNEDNFIVPTSECFSLRYNATNDLGVREVSIAIIISPIDFIIHNSTITKLMKMKEVFDEGTNRPKSTIEAASEAISCIITCSSVNIRYPISSINHGAFTNSNLSDLFLRSGYTFSENRPIYEQEFTLSLIVEDLRVNLKQGLMPSARDEILSISQITLSCQKSIVGFIIPVTWIMSNNVALMLGFDLLVFESETKIDSKSLITFEYIWSDSRSASSLAKRRRAKKYFPSVVPLSTVKAAQQQDLKEQRSNCSVKGSDPQSVMLSDCSDCDRNLLVYVPNIIIDVCLKEVRSLLHILDTFNVIEQKFVDDSSESSCKRNLSSYGFRCDQITVTFHQQGTTNASSCPLADAQVSYFSYTLAVDQLSIHLLAYPVDSNKNIRLLCHDLNFVEAEHIIGDINSRRTPENLESLYMCRQRCSVVRKRRIPELARALIFRSKLCQPLSPRTPAITLDILLRQDEEGDLDERFVYLSIYDITYRVCDLEHRWIYRLAVGIPSKNSSVIHSDKLEKMKESTITKIFTSIADCDIDYISPPTFRVGASYRVRVGEVRLSTNFICPVVEKQTIKLSIADVGMHLCNERTNYKLENSRLICSQIFFKSEDMAISKQAVPISLEDALGLMKFIAIATLDCIDATVTMFDSHDEPSSIPSLAITTALGRLTLYCCRDSFSCLSESIGELALVLTSPQMGDSSLYLNRREVPGNARSARDENTILTDAMQQNLFLMAEELNTHVVDDNLEKTCDSDLSASELRSKYHLNNISINKNSSTLPSDFYSRQAHHSHQKRRGKSMPHLSSLHSSDDCWMTVDYPWSCDNSIPQGEQQSAKWYSNESSSNSKDDTQYSSILLPENMTMIVEGRHCRKNLQVFPQHMSMNSLRDPTSIVHMDLTKITGTPLPPGVNIRLIVNDMTLVCRFFDGYDWIHCRSSRTKTHDNTHSKKTHLMGELMQRNDDLVVRNIFTNDDADTLERLCQTEINGKRRQTNRFFQFQFTGLRMRLEMLADAPNHSIASVLNLLISDFFLAETISGGAPLKVIGEWVNDKEHPRDTNDGLVMMKMVTMRPTEKHSSDGKVMSDECRASVELLPIRCFIRQCALQFMREFFSNIDDGSSGDDTRLSSSSSLIEPPPPIFFQVFKVKPVKLKVDYRPDHVDASALKDGNLVELLNLLPLEEMILRLNAVEIRHMTGWGAIVSELILRWLENITSNQIHKFITRTSPLQPLASVGDGVKELVMIPLEAYRCGGNVKLGLRKGASELVGRVAYEAAKATGRITHFAATALDQTARGRTYDKSSIPFTSPSQNVFSRGSQALDSLSRGVKEANAKIIIIPYREYQSSGPKGAMKSVIKGLPVAVCAPLSGAAEAITLGLMGLCDQLRPDLKEEEEASTRGLSRDM